MLAIKLVHSEFVVLTFPDGRTIRLRPGSKPGRVEFDLPDDVRLHRVKVPHPFELVPPTATTSQACLFAGAGPRVVSPAPPPPPADIPAPAPPLPPAAANPVPCAHCGQDGESGSPLCTRCLDRLPSLLATRLRVGQWTGYRERSALTFLKQLDAMPRKSDAGAASPELQEARS